MPNVLSPSQWSAAVDYDSWNDPFTPDDGVALHHLGGQDYASHLAPYSVAKEAAQLRSSERHHLNKGWRGLAYGWGVGQTGTIYRIRGFNGYGAHTGDIDGDGIANNQEIVPILFIGSGNRVRLSVDAQNSVEWLRREIIEVTSPKAIKLYGHREISPATGTTCPGPYGMEYVNAHRLLQKGEDVRPTEWSEKDKEVVAATILGAEFGGAVGSPRRRSLALHVLNLESLLISNDKLIRAIDFSGLSEADVQAIVNGILTAGVGEAVVEALDKALGPN